MSARNSLTVVLPLRDAAACQLELERQRPALEQGWAKIPGLISACLALLPASAEHAQVPAALLLECSFETPFADLLFVSFKALGRELSAVLAHCAEYPESADASAYAEYLGARARRSSTFRSAASPSDEFEFGRSVRRVLDALAAFAARRLAQEPTLDAALLEARRAAVGMQESVPGVPLVHVAWLSDRAGSRPRTKRALRELEREPASIEHDARFLIADARLVFVAYPAENAQRWSERLSQVALATCARVWRNTAEFPVLFGAPVRRRQRRLQEFVLEQRVPVAAWFNVRRES